MESTDFEDAIRLAVSLGGDADTMGAITGTELSELVDKSSKCVDVYSLERLLKKMGYNVIAVSEGYIYFCGKQHTLFRK